VKSRNREFSQLEKRRIYIMVRVWI